jgi:hypothetical protein
MPKRINPDFVLFGVGGSVSMVARNRLYLAAKKEGVSPSSYIGSVLMEFAETLPACLDETDPRQGKLFSKLDTTEELLEERRRSKEKPKDVVGFSKGHKMITRSLVKKVKVPQQRKQYAKRVDMVE